MFRISLERAFGLVAVLGVVTAISLVAGRSIGDDCFYNWTCEPNTCERIYPRDDRTYTEENAPHNDPEICVSNYPGSVPTCQTSSFTPPGSTCNISYDDSKIVPCEAALYYLAQDFTVDGTVSYSYYRAVPTIVCADGVRPCTGPCP